MEPVHRSHGSIRSSAAPVEVRDLGMIDYEVAWELQRDIVEARVVGGPDTLLTLQHPPSTPRGGVPNRRSGPSTARLSSTPTVAARSRGTDPASWSATR